MKTRLLLVLCLSVTVSMTGCTAVAQHRQPAPHVTAAPVQLASNVPDNATEVPVDTVVTATASHGNVTAAGLYFGTDPKQNVVGGSISGSAWIAHGLLEPGQTYHLVVQGRNADGNTVTVTRTFATQQLTLDQQTYPSVAPLQGETVGVGMPVIVKFDLPVTNRAVFERKMHVRSTPAVDGSWSWLSDREVHFRPKRYWPAGTTVRIALDVNGLPAGNGVYGQQDQDVAFTIGRAVISTVNMAAHTLTVAINGKAVRTLPVTTGDASHQTRTGTKVIMEKFASIDMDAATTGVDSTEPGYYNIKDVRWAMRVTNSGEFLHAAPWSVASQGNTNVSHGCVGLSTANAAWFYRQSRRGDVVKFIHSTRGLEPGNGWTDWDLDWTAYANRSAL